MKVSEEEDIRKCQEMSGEGDVVLKQPWSLECSDEEWTLHKMTFRLLFHFTMFL